MGARIKGIPMAGWPASRTIRDDGRGPPKSNMVARGRGRAGRSSLPTNPGLLQGCRKLIYTPVPPPATLSSWGAAGWGHSARMSAGVRLVLNFHMWRSGEMDIRLGAAPPGGDRTIPGLEDRATLPTPGEFPFSRSSAGVSSEKPASAPPSHVITSPMHSSPAFHCLRNHADSRRRRRPSSANHQFAGG